MYKIIKGLNTFLSKCRHDTFGVDLCKNNLHDYVYAERNASDRYHRVCVVWRQKSKLAATTLKGHGNARRLSTWHLGGISAFRIVNTAWKKKHFSTQFCHEVKLAEHPVRFNENHMWISNPTCLDRGIFSSAYYLMCVKFAFVLHITS